MSSDTPHILLVNPWIHDFAAYDVWAKPLGLLTLAAILRQWGYRVSYIDCLDRFHPRAPRTDPRARNGRGPYRKRPIRTSPGSRGCAAQLLALRYRPRLVARGPCGDPPPGPGPGHLHDDLLVSGGERNHRRCPGRPRPRAGDPRRDIRHPVPGSRPESRRCRPGGGGSRDPASSADLVGEFAGARPRTAPSTPGSGQLPYPAFDLQREIGYIPLLTTIGCPFRCAYCAAGFLNPQWMRRSPEGVLEEIALLAPRPPAWPILSFTTMPSWWTPPNMPCPCSKVWCGRASTSAFTPPTPSTCAKSTGKPPG